MRKKQYKEYVIKLLIKSGIDVNKYDPTNFHYTVEAQCYHSSLYFKFYIARAMDRQRQS